MSLLGMTECVAQHLERFLSRLIGGAPIGRDIESRRCWTEPRTGWVRFDDSLRVASDARGRMLVDARSAGGGFGRIRVTPAVKGVATATPPLHRSDRFDSERLLEA